MKTILKIASVCCFVLMSSFVFAGGNKDTLLIKKNLKTLDGKVFNFSEFAKNKASILVFMAPDCPISQKYTLSLREISEKYKDKNIPVYLIFPGTYYTKKTISKYE